MAHERRRSSLYNIDATHAAVFSLPTMKFALLPETGASVATNDLGKTVSRRSDALAVTLYGNSTSEWAVAII